MSNTAARIVKTVFSTLNSGFEGCARHIGAPNPTFSKRAVTPVLEAELKCNNLKLVDGPLRVHWYEGQESNPVLTQLRLRVRGELLTIDLSEVLYDRKLPKHTRSAVREPGQLPFQPLPYPELLVPSNKPTASVK